MDFLTPHLLLLRFHCVGGFGDQTQDCCDFDISQTVLYITTRLHLILN